MSQPLPVRVSFEFGELAIEIDSGGRTFSWDPKSLGSEGADESESSEWLIDNMIVNGMNELLGGLLRAHAQLAISTLPEAGLLTFARVLRDTFCAREAVVAASRFLRRHPLNNAANAILCSSLRQYDSLEALRRTEHVTEPSAALLTSQAAAWCDIGEPIVARLVVQRANGRVYHSTGCFSEHARRVIQRIGSRYPDLARTHFPRDEAAFRHLREECRQRHGITPKMTFLTPPVWAIPSPVDPRLLYVPADRGD